LKNRIDISRFSIQVGNLPPYEDRETFILELKKWIEEKSLGNTYKKLDFTLKNDTKASPNPKIIDIQIFDDFTKIELR
jgi:hypothetical protein